MATLAEPLVVEVRGPDGAVAVGARVRFQGSTPGVYPAGVAIGAACSSLTHDVTVLTGSDGRASACVRFDTSIGVGQILFTVPNLNLRDSAVYSAAPGKAAQIVVSPKATVLVPNRTVQLQAIVTDRWGNVRADVVQYSSPSAGISVATTGEVRTISPGRSQVYVGTETVRDSAPVVVIPLATFAATRRAADTGDTLAVVTFNSEFPGTKRLTAVEMNPALDRAPYWAPAGDRIVFHEGLYFDMRLFTVDLQGTVKQLMAPGSSTSFGEVFGQYSRDGVWIFFIGRQGNGTGEIWRVAADGTGARRVGPAAGVYLATQPSPSPDGSQVVFSSDCCTTLQLLDVSTGTVRSLGVTASGPRWSPQGDRIAAFTSAGILIMSPDGSQQRIVGTPGVNYAGYPGTDWSPDGKWIVVRGAGGIELIEIATNLVVPIPGTARLTQPSWRP